MKLFHARFAQPQPGGSVTVLEDDFYLPDQHSVRRQLRNKGYWPISITEQRPPMFEWLDVRSRSWQLQLLRALRFQSATTSAGTALLNIIEGEQDSRRRLAFLPTRTVLKGGGFILRGASRAAPHGRGDHGDHHRRRTRRRS